MPACLWLFLFGLNFCVPFIERTLALPHSTEAGTASPEFIISWNPSCLLSRVYPAFCKHYLLLPKSLQYNWSMLSVLKFYREIVIVTCFIFNSKNSGMILWYFDHKYYKRFLKQINTHLYFQILTFMAYIFFMSLK